MAKCLLWCSPQIKMFRQIQKQGKIMKKISKRQSPCLLDFCIEATAPRFTHIDVQCFSPDDTTQLRQSCSHQTSTKSGIQQDMKNVESTDPDWWSHRWPEHPLVPAVGTRPFTVTHPGPLKHCVPTHPLHFRFSHRWRGVKILTPHQAWTGPFSWCSPLCLKFDAHTSTFFWRGVKTSACVKTLLQTSTRATCTPCRERATLHRRHLRLHVRGALHRTRPRVGECHPPPPVQQHRVSPRVHETLGAFLPLPHLSDKQCICRKLACATWPTQRGNVNTQAAMIRRAQSDEEDAGPQANDVQTGLDIQKNSRRQRMSLLQWLTWLLTWCLTHFSEEATNFFWP